MYLKQKKASGRQKKRTRIFVIVIAAVVLGLIAVFVILQLTSRKNQTSPVSSDSNTATTQTNANTTNQPPANTVNSDGTKKVTQYEGKDPNESKDLTGHITSAFLANGKFSLRVSINQYVSDGGTCNLTMTKDSQNFTTSVPLVADVSNSTCQGFDAPESQVSAGKWKVKIELVGNNGKKGKIESEVNL